MHGYNKSLTVSTVITVLRNKTHLQEDVGLSRKVKMVRLQIILNDESSYFFNRLEKEKNILTQEADELAESNEKLQRAKAALEKNNRSLDSELSEAKSAVSPLLCSFNTP